MSIHQARIKLFRRVYQYKHKWGRKFSKQFRAVRTKDELVATFKTIEEARAASMTLQDIDDQVSYYLQYPKGAITLRNQKNTDEFFRIYGGHIA